jgi:hypothetical protein
MFQQITKLFFPSAEGLASALNVLFAQAYNCTCIEDIHKHVKIDKLRKGTDQSTVLHRLVYDDFDRQEESTTLPHYYSLLIEWLALLRLQYQIYDWALQRYPSVRFQLPNNISVFEFHRDSTYNHPYGEINHFLSITRSIGSAALHIEEHLGWEDYAPLELERCQSAILNTSIFKHGDIRNVEEYTRVSMDFRAIPYKCLEEGIHRRSLSKVMLLNTTEYFIASAELEKMLNEGKQFGQIKSRQ